MVGQAVAYRAEDLDCLTLQLIHHTSPRVTHHNAFPSSLRCLRIVKAQAHVAVLSSAYAACVVNDVWRVIQLMQSARQLAFAAM